MVWNDQATEPSATRKATTELAYLPLPTRSPPKKSGLALETGLTAYDASYLWLSRRLGADLVTLDKALGNAAAPGS